MLMDLGTWICLLMLGICCSKQEKLVIKVCFNLMSFTYLQTVSPKEESKAHKAPVPKEVHRVNGYPHSRRDRENK